MRFVIIIVALGITFSHLYAKEQHGAHEHGKGKLDIAIDGNVINMEFESPSISIYGFEHEPKNEAQTKERDKAVNSLRSDISKILTFDSKLGCKVELSKVEPFVKEDHDHEEANGGPQKGHATIKAKEEHHGEHGELHAQFIAKCQANPSGSMLSIDFWKTFPKLQTIEVQVVGEKTQKGGTITKSKNSIKL